MSLQGQAQKNISFLDEFNRTATSRKADLVAAKNFSDIAEIYPLLKDSLLRIKKMVYADPARFKQKYAFDRIDANIEVYSKNYARAIFILENSLRNHVTDIDDSLRCLVGLKNLFIKIKNYNKAIEICYILEKKWNLKNDTASIGYGTGKSGIYNKIGLNERAIFERKKEFARMNLHDSNSFASYYNDLGVFFNLLKRSDSAEHYLLKARSYLAGLKHSTLDATQHEFFKALIDGNLGLAYYNAHRLDEAIPLLKKDVYYSLSSGNYESAFNSYILLVKISLDQKDRQRAKLYLDSAELIVTKEIKETQPKLRLLLIKAEYYDITGDLLKANQCYKNYLALDKFNNEIENAQEQKNENISLSVERKEDELAEKENLLKEAQLKEARQNLLDVYLFAGLLVLTAIIALLIYNNRSAKKREKQLSLKNMQISAQKKLTEQALKDKEILIKEIHHRVKNNLQIITSMLSLQLAKVDDEKTAVILRDARQRISSIALTHQMLYQKENLSNINLGEYVEKLVRQVENLMPASGIELLTNITSQGSRLTIDNAVPLGLLINEVLTNAYKHAFPKNAKGRITVTLSEDAQLFNLTVSDNGVGLPKDFDNVERKTLGIELIYILAEQLDSKLVIEHTNGSTFTLKIKKTF